MNVTHLEDIRYRAPESAGRGPAFLVAHHSSGNEVWYPFYDTVEVRRDHSGELEPAPGVLLVDDPTVSRSHCVVTYRADGTCVIRDTSRNGTRVDGRRLVPNVEVTLEPGQQLGFGTGHEFVVLFERNLQPQADDEPGTVAAPSRCIVTVLVGDIRNYTVLARRAPTPEVQQSVSTVFQLLADEIGSGHGGTVKEFQGDAIVAFWEGRFLGEQAVAACRAALQLDRLATRLASDPVAWRVENFPLAMDWALATGPVMLDSFGTGQPSGLSMIGEAPVLAFRLEKFADDRTGNILACRTTRDMACAAFRFRDLGKLTPKGFDRPDHVFALEGERAEIQTAGS